MTRIFCTLLAGVALCLLCGGDLEGRGFGGFGGFGGFHGGGFGGFHAGGFGGYGGYHVGGYGGYGGYHAPSYGYGAYRAPTYGVYRAPTYSAYRAPTYSAYRAPSYEGYRGGFDTYRIGAGAYPHAIAGPHATTVTPAAAAARTREVNVVGAEGRGIEGYRQRAGALGPYGIGGGAAGAWRSAYSGTHFATDHGLAHYSAFNAAGLRHTTSFWSHDYMVNHAGFVRSNFGYYHCFRPGWWNRYPGCWWFPGWTPWWAWNPISFLLLYNWWGVPVVPIDYDYGSNIVYQNNNVYVNGQDFGSAQNYAQQAITLADKGQKVDTPPEADWKALGVFALVTGDEKTSNNLFQLAVNKDGVIRGNYYDGLMDTTSPVFGSVDQKTQRAAWTVGKKSDRTFEAGIYNLTRSETPVLVHFGTDRTQQWLLVRVEQPAASKDKEN